jgi:diguanylate cyclase (GGDEF)-like protein/PAS domain S-box-containing protein
MLVEYAPLKTILSELVLLIEEQQPNALCSVLLLSEDKEHLIEGAAPSLPKFYREATDGVAIGDGVGSCGTAVFREERIIVSDIATHKYWADFKALALEANLRACWSEPILSSHREVLGTFAIYYNEVRKPSAKDIAIIGDAARIAGIAIERERTEKAQQLTASIYNNLPYAIVITNDAFQILSTNPSFERITGYAQEDVEGLEPFMLMSPNKSSEHYRHELSLLKEKESKKEEIISQKKNGEDYFLEQTITVLRNTTGQIEKYIWLFDDISERKKAQTIIQHQANYDLLTDLPNRNLLLERLNWAMKLSERNHGSFGLVILGLDHFKEINDILGHEVGDQLLIEVAKRLKTLVQSSDTIARLGGDEFAIVISSVSDGYDLEVLVNNLIESICQPYDLASAHESCFITTSVGIAVYPNDGTELEQLFRAADQAMYSAKEQGRNCFSFFTEGMQQKADSQARLHKELKHALLNNELELHYQPILNLHTNQLDKAECLIRWNHPERGMISPAQFIPVAEKTGLIKELGVWIREEACKQIKRCIADGLSIRFSVNVSTLEFWSGELVNSILESMERYSVIAEYLTVEITESLFMKNQQEIILALSNLRTLGVRISIDDFGTGYSSLSYLGSFPLDELKIDRSFVDGIEAEERKQSLVNAMITLSHKLGMKVVAEGIETQSQLELLTKSGCDYAQGFLFSKPLNTTDFTKFAVNHWIKVNPKYIPPNHKRNYKKT